MLKRQHCLLHGDVFFFLNSSCAGTGKDQELDPDQVGAAFTLTSRQLRTGLQIMQDIWPSVQLAQSTILHCPGTVRPAGQR